MKKCSSKTLYTKNLIQMHHMISNIKKHIHPSFLNTKHMTIEKSRKCYQILWMRIKIKTYYLKPLLHKGYFLEILFKSFKDFNKLRILLINRIVLKGLRKKVILIQQILGNIKTKLLRFQAKMKIRLHRRCYSPQKEVLTWLNSILMIF